MQMIAADAAVTSGCGDLQTVVILPFHMTGERRRLYVSIHARILDIPLSFVRMAGVSRYEGGCILTRYS